MEKNMKKLIEAINSKDTKEIIINHTKEVLIDNVEKNVTIYIDKNYALNQLTTSEHIWTLNNWIKNWFWEEYNFDLKFSDWANKFHDREMNIPHKIHYN